MTGRLALLCSVSLVAWAGKAAHAQLRTAEVERRLTIGPAGDIVALETARVADGGTELRLVERAGRVTVVARAPTLVGAPATGHGVVLVAFARNLEGAFAARVARPDDGALALAPEVVIDRGPPRRDSPFGVAAAVLPDGFAIFFQELDAADPSLVHTYLVRLDATGRPRGAATEVPLPWPIADAAWNGTGFHLALLYPAPDGMRLSMVSTTDTGQPREHPDWASAAGFIRDVHLVTSPGGTVRAFYLGGPGGNQVMERDVTRIGNWGSEPSPPRVHGQNRAGWFAVGSDGRPRS